MRGKLRASALLGLLVNGLDVTTSLIPSPADHLLALPQRSAWAWSLQLFGLACGLIWAARLLPRALRYLRELPVPPVAGALLGGYFLIALGHVAFRAEHFPFSPVAMFSAAVPQLEGDTFSHTGYVIVRGNWVEPISFLREGSQWFEQLRLGYDYKAGWALRLYGPTHSSARGWLARTLRAQEQPEPIRAILTQERASGRWRGYAAVLEAR